MSRCPNQTTELTKALFSAEEDVNDLSFPLASDDFCGDFHRTIEAFIRPVSNDLFFHGEEALGIEKQTKI
jgi:hypothetical protein